MRTIDDVLAYLDYYTNELALRASLDISIIKRAVYESQANVLANASRYIRREVALASLGRRETDSDTEVAGDVCGRPGEEVASGSESGVVPVRTPEATRRSDDTDGYSDDKHFRSYWRRNGDGVSGHGNSPRTDAVLPYSP